MIGLLVALTLSPGVRSLVRFGIPRLVSAVALVLGAAGALGLAAYVLSGPVS